MRRVRGHLINGRKKIKNGSPEQCILLLNLNLGVGARVELFFLGAFDEKSNELVFRRGKKPENDSEH